MILQTEADDILMPHTGIHFSEENYKQSVKGQSSPFDPPTETKKILTTEKGHDERKQSVQYDKNGEDKDTRQDNSPHSTSRERKTVSKHTCQQLEKLSRTLKTLCRESDPQFVNVGRDLTIVTQDVRKLTATVHHAVDLIQKDQDGKTSLKKTETLLQDVFATLSEERKVIEKDAGQVKNLVTQIFKCARIREMIDRINTLFRIVRINIRIQCSARGLSDEMFEGVSEDLDKLSKILHQVTRQILKDINYGLKSLANLQKSIGEHLKQIDSVFLQTKSIVSKAFHDIRQLMDGTETMIRAADSISTKVSEKVNEVVISIQFHDSLSQRVEHIVHAFDDIIELCENKHSDITEEHLGTAFIILDLQLRQLVQIREEIKLVHERIESDFIVIESEIEGLGSILYDKQFQSISPQQFLSTLFSSLEDTLKSLNFLLEEGEGMIGQIKEKADETKSIANNLKQLKENVSEIREETRVQAVNTIIMASALGHQGKTIEVLAKEIQTLSDQSSVLADDVEAMQLAVSQTVEDLITNTSKKENQIDRNDLAKEIGCIKISFRETMEVVSQITQQIEISGSHISKTRAALVFLDTLEINLDCIILPLRRTLDKLSPWEGKGVHDGQDIEQLINRYSMAQERMIHMFDRVDEATDTGDEDDVFF